MTLYLQFMDANGKPTHRRKARTYAAARARIYSHFNHAVLWENAWSWCIYRVDGPDRVILAMSKDCEVKSMLSS